MATLYVVEQGTQLEKEYERLVVMQEDQRLFAVPMARVGHVVLVGRVHITMPALAALLAHDIGLSLVTRTGRLRGHLVAPYGKNLDLRRRQMNCAQDVSFCLNIANSIADGKLRNYRTMARRLARSHPVDAQAIAQITAALSSLDHVRDLAAVRGAEGQGSRAYFAVLRQGLAPQLAFGPRSRRPPRDPVNALLSLGYTLLTQGLMTACELAALDPYDGFFHSDKYGRPALALDLVEEFRSVIVDSLVLNLVNRQRLQPDDFTTGEGGAVILDKRALRLFVQAYAARVHTEVLHPVAGRPLSYLKLFEVQARAMRRVIEGTATEYRPFLTK